MSCMSDSLLIIMVKNPELGKCKTRLAKTIGNEKALLVYKELLKYTSFITHNLEQDVQILYASFVDDNDMFNNQFFSKDVQVSGELGKKMQSAFENAFAKGYKKISIIGSDCRELTAQIIEQAFAYLQSQDAVIGPANDGGYYLLGLSKPFYDVFKNKFWSTESVYSDTINDFKNAGLTYANLPQLSDVDHEEDLTDELKNLI